MFATSSDRHRISCGCVSAHAGVPLRNLDHTHPRRSVALKQLSEQFRALCLRQCDKTKSGLGVRMERAKPQKHKRDADTGSQARVYWTEISSWGEASRAIFVQISVRLMSGIKTSTEARLRPRRVSPAVNTNTLAVCCLERQIKLPFRMYSVG